MSPWIFILILAVGAFLGEVLGETSIELSKSQTLISQSSTGSRCDSVVCVVSNATRAPCRRVALKVDRVMFGSRCGETDCR